jgi:hypothetical protein
MAVNEVQELVSQKVLVLTDRPKHLRWDLESFRLFGNLEEMRIMHGMPCSTLREAIANRKSRRLSRERWRRQRGARPSISEGILQVHQNSKCP